MKNENENKDGALGKKVLIVKENNVERRVMGIHSLSGILSSSAARMIKNMLRLVRSVWPLD